MGAGALWDSARMRPPARLDDGLFVLALLIYLMVRLIGLDQFPIYFFSDEAIQTMTAHDLLLHGLAGPDGVFLPTFFMNGGRYNLSLSVYLQLLPTWLFGESVFVTRATAVLATLPAAVSVGLIVRDIFRLPHAWVAILLLSVTPAWFLHSRTAFETTLAVSLYAAGLYLYLCYRCRSPRALYAAVACFALAFYSYSPAQPVVVITALLLLISDARYHLEQRRTVGLAALLAMASALPLIRFHAFQPESYGNAMRMLDSYWAQPLPLTEKLARFGAEYLSGLDPRYWFGSPSRDLVRHLMRGWGHLLIGTAPLLFIGVATCLWHWRNAACRAVVIATLAAPVGAALAHVLVTRVLFMVIPATLLSAIGLIAMVSVLPRVLTGIVTLGAARLGIAAAAFFTLAGVHVLMLRDALLHGPTWYTDYGLYGMQWGAKPVFEAVLEELERDPHTRIVVSPNWANNFDVLARFFLHDPVPIGVGTIMANVDRWTPFDGAAVYVMTPEELDAVSSSGKFADIRIERTIPNPAGQPGFHFVRLRYSDDVAAIFAAEAAARRTLHYQTGNWLGQNMTVGYSALDIGTIADAFDGNPDTVIRTGGANPLVLDLSFDTPRPLRAIVARLGNSATTVSIEATPADSGSPVVAQFTYPGFLSTTDFRLDLPSPITARSLRVAFEQLDTPEPAHVHLWEFRLE